MAVSIEEYKKALESLDEAMHFFKSDLGATQKKIARDACIQRFEFCVELAWKTAGKALGSDSTAANLIIREMARNEFIDDPELWFEFVKARNMSSHTYDEKIATKVFEVVQQFIPHGKKLLEVLQSK